MPKDLPRMSTSETYTGPVLTTAPGTTTTISSGFNGTIDYNGGLIDITGLVGPYGSTNITDWHAGGGSFEMGTRGGRVVDFGISDLLPRGNLLHVYQLGNEFYATGDAGADPAGSVPLLGRDYGNAPLPPPAVSILDTTTGASVPDTFSTGYTGPVAGIGTQMIDITTDSLNITANTPSMFIKTGAGNDAVALKGGTNVVDAGGGSNFLTAGGGFDTFFLDGRAIPQTASAAGPVPGALWDTIQGFVKGDAATIFGVGPGTALDWQKNEGAVGHKGITLHAIEPAGSTVSLTLTGIADTSRLFLSYGSVGGSTYLYVKAI